jgi:hypothetical protein
VMPSDSPQNNSALNSLAANPPSGYTNISLPGRASSSRFDRRVLPNYSSSFVSSSLVSASHKSSTMVHRHSGGTPALPVPLLICKRCGRSYACEYTLKRHIRLECGKEATLQCPICPRRTKHKHSLLRHINTFHPGARIWFLPFNLSLCKPSASKRVYLCANRYVRCSYVFFYGFISERTQHVLSLDEVLHATIFKHS